MDNMKVYNAVRNCPNDALKPIQAGRLKGKSDINPMWRIKALTEQFGPVGIGWYYEITRQWLENGANDEIAAFCNISLYVKIDGEWSKPIQGTGGSAFIAKESKGLYTSDECFKMALTDAISVACKALGFAADVYWAQDKTKYDAPNNQAVPVHKCADCGAEITKFKRKTGEMVSAEEAYKLTLEKYGAGLCLNCTIRRTNNAESN